MEDHFVEAFIRCVMTVGFFGWMLFFSICLARSLKIQRKIAEELKEIKLTRR